MSESKLLRTLTKVPGLISIHHHMHKRPTRICKIVRREKTLFILHLGIDTCLSTYFHLPRVSSLTSSTQLYIETNLVCQGNFDFLLRFVKFLKNKIKTI